MISRSRDIQAPWRLVCERLCVERGGRQILHDVDLEIETGQCVSLIGPNGSGKTTLMLTLLGLLSPASGSVRVDGREVGRLPPRVRGRFASYVPQTVERLPGFSIYEVVASGRFPHVAPLRPLSNADREHVEAALEMCGLTDLASRRIDSISGGERQKTLIAAAVAQDAQVMFLDEPNTALDPGYQIELVRLLQRWHTRRRGLVLISHELSLPAVLGGRVVALCEGRVVMDGDAEDTLTPDRLSEVYGAAFEVLETADGRRITVPKWWHDDTSPVTTGS
jgi:iron complex transport system ATP-binding protein